MAEAVYYTTLEHEGEAEFTEKRSVFIAHARPISSEEEALAYIKKQKSDYADARHNVWAYMMKGEIVARYSDDGEPQGTAGIPVLDVLEKSGVVDICVVATRYFGGILLGGGGLVRAYSHTAKIALDAAQKLTMAECKELEIRVDYSLYGKLNYILPDYEVKLLDSDFGVEVTLHLLMKSHLFPGFEKAFREMTNGKNTITVLADRFDFF